MFRLYLFLKVYLLTGVIDSYPMDKIFTAQSIDTASKTNSQSDSSLFEIPGRLNGSYQYRSIYDEYLFTCSHKFILIAIFFIINYIEGNDIPKAVCFQIFIHRKLIYLNHLMIVDSAVAAIENAIDQIFKIGEALKSKMLAFFFVFYNLSYTLI